MREENRFVYQSFLNYLCAKMSPAVEHNYFLKLIDSIPTREKTRIVANGTKHSL